MAAFRVVVVTDGGARLAERVRALLAVGVEVLVREPTLPEDVPWKAVIAHARMPGALAVAHQLHLPATGDLAATKAIFRGPIGQSCHDVHEVARAREFGAAYTVLSPAFAPRHGRPARGLDGAAGSLVLGGVTHENVSMCRRAGAVGVLVMGAVWHAADPLRAAEALLKAATRPA